MRSIILAAITVTTFGVVGCGGEEPVPVTPPAPPPAPSVTATASAPPAPTETAAPAPPPKPALSDLIPQTLKGIADAVNAHDAKKVATYYTDEAIVSAYGYPATNGRDGVAGMLQAMFAVFSDLKFAAPRIWIKGNVAVVETVSSGTMTGDFLAIKATKKPAGNQGVFVYSFNDDGLVKESRHYSDDAGLLAQFKGAKGAPPVPVVPTSPPEVHVAKGTPDEDKLADWARSIDDVAGKGDVPAAAALVSDDGDVWINVAAAPAAKGKKDVGKALGVWTKAFADQKWSTTNAWGIDGYAIIEHSVSATQKAGFGTLPTSSKAISGWHWITILQPTADNKIAHSWAYANAMEAGEQTGALKLPVPTPDKKSAAVTDKASSDGGSKKKPPVASPAAPAKK
ncbi:MAG: ester cyclase [Polyangiaceae bacterium]